MIDPPTNLPAEVALLGGVMGLGRIDEAAAHVTASDFYRHAHRIVWDACLALSDRVDPIDLSTVTAALAAKGQLDEVGGAAALSDMLAEGAPSSKAVAHHGREVATAARRRRVIEAARRLALAVKESGEGIDEAVEEAVESFTVKAGRSGIIDREDLALAIIDRLGTSDEAGVSTGWPKLDRFYRVPRGMMTVVTGVPGHGKSTWVDSLVVQLAQHHGWRFAMFSPEQAPAEKHALRLIHTVSGKDPQTLGGRLERGMDWVLDHFTFLDDQHDNTIAGILSRARLVARRGRLDGLVVDPWNKIRHERGRHARDDLYLQDALHQVTRFSRQTGVHVWVVAHPLKMERETPNSSRWKVPTVYDISGGSEWNNQADAIISVWRDQDGEDQDPAIAEVAVQKVRDQGQWGRLGGTKLVFVEERRMFGTLGAINDDRSSERTTA